MNRKQIFSLTIFKTIHRVSKNIIGLIIGLENFGVQFLDYQFQHKKIQNIFRTSVLPHFLSRLSVWIFISLSKEIRRIEPTYIMVDDIFVKTRALHGWQAQLKCLLIVSRTIYSKFHLVSYLTPVHISKLILVRGRVR